MPSKDHENKEKEMMLEIGNLVKKKIPEEFGFAVLCYGCNPDGTEENPVWFVSDTSIPDVVEAMKVFVKKHELDQEPPGPSKIN